MRFKAIAMSRQDWLELGIAAGYCSEPECQTHNMIEMTEDEQAFFEDGGDPCVPVVRLWNEGETPVRGPQAGITTFP